MEKRADCRISADIVFVSSFSIPAASHNCRTHCCAFRWPLSWLRSIESNVLCCKICHFDLEAWEGHCERNSQTLNKELAVGAVSLSVVSRSSPETKTSPLRPADCPIIIITTTLIMAARKLSHKAIESKES